MTLLAVDLQLSTLLDWTHLTTVKRRLELTISGISLNEMWKLGGHLQFWCRVVSPHCLVVHPVQTLAFTGLDPGQLEEVGHPAGGAGLGHLQQQLDQRLLWKVNLAPGDPVLLRPVEVPTHEACVASAARWLPILPVGFHQLHLTHTISLFSLCPTSTVSPFTNVEVIFHLHYMLDKSQKIT